VARRRERQHGIAAGQVRTRHGRAAGSCPDGGPAPPAGDPRGHRESRGPDSGSPAAGPVSEGTPNDSR
jgi:hypothetical protein